MAFIHQRHKPPSPLQRPRELVVVCAPLRSNVNLSHIARLASCCGLSRLICCGQGKILAKIARDGAHSITLEVHRTVPPVLRALRAQGYQLVALEQTTGSESLFDFAFQRRTALVVGNERLGLDEKVLRLVDRVAEIPIYSPPHSLNVAMSTAMALYEYCRQYPEG